MTKKIIQKETPKQEINPKATYILGIDPARTGKDQTAFVILIQPPFGEDIFIVYAEAIHTPDLKQVIGKALYLNKFFNFKKIIVDETGLGAGVTDILKGRLKGKVEGIWYTSKKKAEIFQNLKILMSRPSSKLYFPDYNTCKNPVMRKFYFQFLSIISEYNDETGTKIPKIYHEKGKHDDLVNALALACTAFKVTGKISRKPLISGFNYTS